MAILVFLAIAIISATLWHRFVAGFGSAVLGATITTVVLFQAAAYVEAGHLDAFAGIAAVTTAVVAVVISIVIGLPFRARRKAEKSSAI
ncbi:hypothetical protein [Usitatibacter rugosus]|uniref:hypothetical protein n=1 Tax=Usitatibacter rugosus TaxID=2732067 RepID=UPI001488C1A9|nr:hypothetical protein [Usitatibacter rugosus]